MWARAHSSGLVIAACISAGAVVTAPGAPPPAHERAWVFFADKGVEDVPSALAALEVSYHPRAVERRRLRRTAPGLFDERDLPVAEAYVEAVAATGATIRVRSRWLNAISVCADAAQRDAIAAVPYVVSMQPVRPLRPCTEPDDRPPGLAAGGFYGGASGQLAQINLIALHEQGFTGAGVIVGVLDTGFRRTHLAFNDARHPLEVAAEWDFVNDDPDAGPQPGDGPTQHNHGTLILGTLGSWSPGLLVAGAYDASFVLAKVEDVGAEYPAEEDLFAAGLEFIEANGGDVATSSVVIFVGYDEGDLDGQTTVMTMALNTATENGLHCFQGAGNEGHDEDPATHHLVPPADAVAAVTVGAVNAAGATAWFSSDGPTVDGRVKPEVLAQGLAAVTVSPDDDVSLTTASGTSLATPLVAAAASCLVQAHPRWTVAQLRSALFQTGSDYQASGSHDQLFVRGYGIVNALAASGTSPSPADIDGDFHVGVSDLVLLILAWGPCPACPPCPPCAGCPADLDRDGVVGVEDLIMLIVEWSPRQVSL